MGHVDAEDVAQQTTQNDGSVMFDTDVPERVGSVSCWAWGMRWWWGGGAPGISMLKQQVGGEKGRQRGACWLKPLLGTRDFYPAGTCGHSNGWVRSRWAQALWRPITMWYCTGEHVSCRVSHVGCICCLVEGWLSKAAAQMDLKG